MDQRWLGTALKLSEMPLLRRLPSCPSTFVDL
jgi:hypothetical protein